MLLISRNLLRVLLLTPEEDIFTTMIQKRKLWLGELKLQVTAGKRQNWGSNQSGWFTAHVSPSYFRVFLLWTDRSISVTEK